MITHVSTVHGGGGWAVTLINKTNQGHQEFHNSLFFA